LEAGARGCDAQQVTRWSEASVARLAALLIGVVGLASAFILSAFECTYPLPDYGVCSDNSALKWELAIAGAILVTLVVASHLTARRRHT
jgi:hypothetical protein